MRHIRLALLFSSVAVSTATADFITADWEADTCPTGVWTDGCWGAEPMPNNGGGDTFHAVISDGNAEVTQNISITLDRLSVFEFNTMILQNTRTLSIVGGDLDGSTEGFMIVDGLFFMNSLGNTTDMKVVGGDFGTALTITSVSAPGEFRISDTLANRVYGQNGTETIRFAGGVTFAGSGQIGLSITTFINDAIVLADQVNALRIDPDAEGLTNNGLMVARDGGRLELYPAPYDNALGEIRAEDGSTVYFNGATVTGGLMLVESGGYFNLQNSELDGPDVQVDPGGLLETRGSSELSGVTNQGQVTQVNASTLRMAGPYQNESTHTMNSAGNTTDFIFVGPTSLEGGGELVLSPTLENRVYSAGEQTLTITDQTVRGSAQFGLSLMSIVNEDTMIADQTSALRVDPNADGMTNNGLMVARDGGLLELYPAPYDNALGEIRAEDGSTVYFNGATVTGGLMLVESGGYFNLQNSVLDGPEVQVDAGGLLETRGSSELFGVTNEGQVTQVNASTLRMAGPYQNESTHTMNSAGNTTDFIFVGPTSLEGGGELVLSPTLANRVYSAGEQTLTIADQTVRGSAQFGLSLMSIVNEDTMIADQTSALRVDPNADGMTNNGLMVARDGGLLELYPAPYDNALGEIRAEDGSTVYFNGATVTGGLMLVESGGYFNLQNSELDGPDVQVDPGGLLVTRGSSELSGVTNQGQVTQVNASTLRMSGPYVNEANHLMNSAGNTTDFIFVGPTSLEGGGELVLSPTLANRVYSAGEQTLTITDQTVRGSAQFGLSLMSIVNEDTMIADQTSALRVDPNADGMTNNGLMVARDGGLLELYPAPYDNALGEIRAEDGSTVYFNGATVTGGLLHVASGGVFDVAGAGTLTLNDSTLFGAGVVIDHVDNASGITAPGASPGTLVIDGDYSQSVDGTLAIEIGGLDDGQFDVLDVGGDATLGGTLDLQFVDGFEPKLGQSFEILTATEVFGMFDDIGSCADVTVTYDVDRVLVTIGDSCTTCPADIDGDGQVAVSDLLAILAAWGDCPGCAADIDGNDAVDVGDLLIVLAEWGPCG